MADPPGAWTQFFAELKRRRVVRVAAVYLAATFVVLQAAPALFQALLLPDWAFRLLVVLLILGFLVAVPLAWAYDVGPGGIRRTVPAEQVPTALRRLTAWRASGDFYPYILHSEPMCVPYFFTDPRFRKLLESAD